MKIISLICLIIMISCVDKANELTLSASNNLLALENGVLNYKGESFNGFIEDYFAEGNLKSRIQYKEGRKNGFEKQWYSNGEISISRNYLNGKKTGVHEGWWENKRPKFKYQFNIKGEYNGKVEEWYASGQPYKAFNYVNGQELGSQKLWKENGTIKANYVVRDGERFGLIGLKKCFTVNSISNEVK